MPNISCKWPRQGYGLRMFGRSIIALVLFAAIPAGFAETLQLKDKTSVTGKILAEKKDQLVVDLGFTVLVVPRNQILKISGDETPTPPRKTSTPPALPPTSPGEMPTEIFQTARSPLSEKSVRDLVNQLGEAVVQVRAPSGLGSGFILNEDGYLI